MKRDDLVNEVAKVVKTQKRDPSGGGLHFLIHYRDIKKQGEGCAGWIRNIQGEKKEGQKRKKSTSRRREQDQSKMGPQVNFWKGFERRRKMISMREL